MAGRIAWHNDAQAFIFTRRTLAFVSAETRFHSTKELADERLPSTHPIRSLVSHVTLNLTTHFHRTHARLLLSDHASLLNIFSFDRFDPTHDPQRNINRFSFVANVITNRVSRNTRRKSLLRGKIGRGGEALAVTFFSSSAYASIPNPTREGRRSVLRGTRRWRRVHNSWETGREISRCNATVLETH